MARWQADGSDDLMSLLRACDPGENIDLDLGALRAKVDAAIAAQSVDASADVANVTDVETEASVTPLKTRRNTAGPEVIAIAARRRWLPPMAAAASVAAVVAVGVGVFAQSIPGGPGLPGLPGRSPLLPAASQMSVEGASTRLDLIEKDVTFEASGLSDEGGKATVFTYAKNSKPTTQDVSKLANSLGLGGDVKKVGDAYLVAGMSGASLRVSIDPLASLVFANPAVAVPDCIPVAKNPNETGAPGTTVAPSSPSAGIPLETPTVLPTNPGGTSPGTSPSDTTPTSPSPTSPTSPPSPTYTPSPEPTYWPTTPPSTGTMAPPIKPADPGIAIPNPAATSERAEHLSAVIPAGGAGAGAAGFAQAVSIKTVNPKDDATTPLATTTPSAPAPSQAGNVLSQTKTPVPPAEVNVGEGATKLNVVTTPECVPQPAPSRAQAVAEVVKVAQALGATVTTAQATVISNAGVTTLSVPVTINGQQTATTWQATVTAKGVSSVRGQLGSQEKLGTYKVVSQAEAVKRLNDAKYGPLDVMGVAGAPVSGKVDIVSASLSSSSVKQADGSSLVMPVYNMTDGQGRVWTVLAVDEQKLKD
ncbi:MAG: hypothetical protein Q4G30_00195 [Actinomycetaceae bacterium]|nr:hypothetical protein [Actinomycetaceae bacterium]